VCRGAAFCVPHQWLRQACRALACVLQELNVVVVKREDNFTFFLQQPGWQSWLAPLLASVPLAEEVCVCLCVCA
jgi:hypothetical protein